MKSLTLYRRDFKDSQDYPHDSFFDYVLKQLGIDENDIDDIDEVTIKNIDTSTIEVYE